MFHHLNPSPFPPHCTCTPCPCTQLVWTWGHRWPSHNMSNPPTGHYTFQSYEALFLDSNYWPSPPLSFRALLTSRGAAAERAGFVLCVGELAPPTGAQRYHHQLQDLVQRQPKSAGALMGKTHSRRWVSAGMSFLLNRNVESQLLKCCFISSIAFYLESSAFLRC